MNNLELLKLLTPAVREIDSGCFTCIIRFIEKANKLLEEAEFPAHFSFDGDCVEVHDGFSEEEMD